MSGELRASFCGAANHLTQLYMVSLKKEKMAYNRGYSNGLDAVIRSLQQLRERNSTVSIDALVDILQIKKREAPPPEDSIEPEDDENKDPRQNINQGFNTSTQALPQTNQFVPPVMPFQPPPQPTRMPSFGQAPAPLSAPSQFSFGTTTPASQPSIPSFTPPISSSAASTFSQAVSNSIPFPSVPFQSQTSLGGSPNRSNSSRKRQFFEFLFDSSPSPGDPPASQSDYLNREFCV